MDYAIAAITLGFVAGLRLGPLGVFVIEQTLRFGFGRGFIVSLAPFITDGPIIALAVLFSLSINEQQNLIVLISFLGSIYMAYIAFNIFFTEEAQFSGDSQVSGGLLRSVKINACNPSPYLFWFTIGNSYIVSATETQAIIFVICILSSLCLTNFLVAATITRLGNHFNIISRSSMLKLLALPLGYLSVKLFCDAIELL